MGRKAKRPLYEFRDGSRVGGADPQAVGEELDRIRAARGELTPEVTVEEARKKASPLHPCFEWDDSRAAHAHRLQQARVLIRCVVVRYEGDEGAAPVSVYAHVPATDGRGARYEPLAVIAERPDLVELALGALRAKLEGAQRAVDELLAAGRDANRPEAAQRALSVKRHLAEAALAAKRAA